MVQVSIRMNDRGILTTKLEADEFTKIFVGTLDYLEANFFRTGKEDTTKSGQNLQKPISVGSRCTLMWPKTHRSRMDFAMRRRVKPYAQLTTGASLNGART